jgi:outer membrane murein-binding lipoprotein Lpp
MKWNWGLTVASAAVAGICVAVICGGWSRVDTMRDQVTINTQRLNVEEAATKAFTEQIKALSEQLSAMKDENTKAHGNIEGGLKELKGLLEGHVGKGGAMGSTGNTDKARVGQ